MALTRQVSRRALVLSPTNAEVSTNQVYTPRYEFLVDGELNLPVPRVINSLKHQDAAASIYRVDVSVNKGGTSQYRIQIISYDQLGLNPITHVDQLITLTNDRLRTTIPVTNAAVGENRSLECTLTESNALVPAVDMTVTVTMEAFSELEASRNGHIIMDEAGNAQAQKDTLQLIGSTVQEDTINQRTVVSSGVIGEVKSCMLTEAQMQLAAGPGWILADGRSVAGSLYEIITGDSSVPDMRGQFLRGKNNGRIDGAEDPDGERDLGDSQVDALENITGMVGRFVGRGINVSVASGAFALNGDNQSMFAGEFGSGGTALGVDFDASRVASTSSETRPKNIVINYFIKIN
jgi:hypothetical protein